jgi:ribosomal protein L35
MKTNKSYTKRLKVTKKGKIIARKAGHGHFNAKESRTHQLNKHRSVQLTFKNKVKSRFLATS